MNTESKSFIDKLNENEEIMEAMLNMPQEANEAMAKSRREELFSPLWEEATMNRDEVINKVTDREQQMINEYSHFNLPDWMLRCEAQDIILDSMHEKFEEEGIIS